MLLLKRHYEYWYLLLALHRLNAVAIPATYMLQQEELVYRVRTADVKAIMIAGEDDALAAHVRGCAAECGSPLQLFSIRKQPDGFTAIDEEMQAFPPVLDRIDNRSTDPFLLYFTSGTTGFPKAVVHEHSYPLAHIITARYWQNVQDGGLHLSVADTGWGKASWGKIYGQWLCGSAVMVYDFEHFNAPQLLEVLRNYHVTTFCAPPTIYRFLVKNGITAEDFAGVSYVTTAGEALNAEIIRLFHEITGLQIHEGYGQTETTMLIGHLVGEPVRDGSMGKPSPLYRVCIVDEHGQPVKAGTVGEIAVLPAPVHDYGLCSGYDHDEEAGARAWRQGVYHTGDTAYCDEDGYYWFVGRTDDIIKSSGYRIGPFEVESALIRHPAVLECAITGAPDPERGCVVKATVVLRPDYTASPELTRELQQFVKQHTAPYKYPRIVEYVAELPKTTSGKIKRDTIRANDNAKA
jgi:acetyl-CoA synthetase